MPVTGSRRYIKLFQNISNWEEYVFHKMERRERIFQFTTRPNPIRFEVPFPLFYVFREIFMEDFYDVRNLLRKLPSKPVVIDIGANAGFFNILLLSKIKEARIFAYEPMASNIRYFSKTIADNPVLKQVKLEQVAVTGQPVDYLELYTADTSDETVVSSVFSDFDKLNNTKIRVPAKSLGGIIAENGLQQVDILKLDCEGSEYDIIYNTEKEVFKKVKMMVIEVHEIDAERYNLKALTGYLGALGYRTRSQVITDKSFYLEATLES